MNVFASFCALFLIAAFAAGIFLLFPIFVKPGWIDYKWKRWIIAGIAMILAVLFFAGSGLLRAPIDLTKVEKMELDTYDHVSSGHAELTQAEQWMITFLYNISLRGGEVTGEPCCAAYGVDIYLSDGSKMGISEGVSSKMIVDLPGMYAEDRFYATCPLLVNYIYILAEKYDLPIE